MGIPTEIGAGDLLGFYRSTLAFVGTLFLGIVAYKQNKKANKTNKDLAVRQLNMLDYNIKPV